MAQVKCERISEGLRASEAVAVVQNIYGRRHFLRVERDFLTPLDGASYLPVGIVHADPRNPNTGPVLIELPQESENGTNRLWVNREDLDEVEAPA